MFTTQEAVTAEIGYRHEQARHAARRAQAERPSLLRRLFATTSRAGGGPAERAARQAAAADGRAAPRRTPRAQGVA